MQIHTWGGVVIGRSRIWSLGYAAMLLSLAPVQAPAQRSNRRPMPGADSTSDPGTSAAVARTVSGRVVDALTGNPIPRALVNLNARAILTDAQGKFSFSAFTDSSANAQVTKPGYASSLTPESARQQSIPDLDAPLELKLYPEAILTGTVSGPDSLPLARIPVSLRRLSFDNTGARWLPAGFTQTDIHGAYRFQVAAGRYQVSTGYLAHSLERGEAVLPVRFPASSSSSNEMFECGSGEQRQIDLRPWLSPSFPVALAVDGGTPDRGLRLVATTPSGMSFQIPTQRIGDQVTTELPTGTFLLRASSGDREENLDGEARVVVSGRGTPPIAIHLIPRPSFPVEVALELAPTSTVNPVESTSSPQQFNLTMHALDNAGDGFIRDARLSVRPDQTASFQLAPGRYRLGGNQGGAWYVRSATVGFVNLLTDELVVAPGAGGLPIRLTVSNAIGRLKGTVTTAGQPSSGWVYLVPQQPTLTPVVEIYIQSGGTYRWSGPPGRYLAVPSAQQVREDFRSVAFLQKFTATGREVDIASGAESSLDLTLAAAGVPR